MANKVYRALETRVTWEASGGDSVITLTSLGAGAGRIGAQDDRGTGSLAEELVLVIRTQWNTTPVEGEVLRVYLMEGWEMRDGGTPSVKEGGKLGASDAAVSAEGDLTSGARLIGIMRVPNSPASATEYVSVPILFRTKARYISIGIWNATVDALHSTAANHEIAVTPAPSELQ